MVSRTVILGLTSAAVLGGTLYSFLNHTYLDTSDPLVAHLSHPLHNQTIFAQKSNVFNTLFVKKAWGWTSLAFLALWLTGPPEQKTRDTWLKWGAATCVWASFVMWFFGPGLFDRFWVASGGECMVLLPNGHEPSAIKVPLEYCVSRSIVSPQTHPSLFTSSLVGADRIEPFWGGRAQFYRGHDISGHIFLLTLSILFLHDQLRPAWKSLASGRYSSSSYTAAVALSTLLMSLWLFMTLMTSVYWHSPLEKISGFIIGLGGFYVTQVPYLLQSNDPATPKRD